MTSFLTATLTPAGTFGHVVHGKSTVVLRLSWVMPMLKYVPYNLRSCCCGNHEATAHHHLLSLSLRDSLGGFTPPLPSMPRKTTPNRPQRPGFTPPLPSMLPSTTPNMLKWHIGGFPHPLVLDPAPIDRQCVISTRWGLSSSPRP